MPTKLFDYDVIDFIGEGAGSAIYVATHRDSRQLYALKHVVRKSDRDVRFIEQLQAEFAVCRQFSDGRLRRCFDLLEKRTLLRKTMEAVLVMEMFDGAPLEVLGPQPLLSVMDWFIEVAAGLQALHALNYVHCDLKPNNILISPDSQVKVIDFGQTCRTGTIKGRIQGTPDYIAPEQVKCEPVTVRTDVFNFGATLYWMLSRRTIPTLYTVKRAENSFLVDDFIPSPRDINADVPENLSSFVMECVRNNPAKRPEDMATVQRRLEIIRHAAARSM